MAALLWAVVGLDHVLEQDVRTHLPDAHLDVDVRNLAAFSGLTEVVDRNDVH